MITTSGGNTKTIPNSNPAQEKVRRLIESGRYDVALGQLRSGKLSPENQNALGVCLLRLGRFEDAVRVYRGLVLNGGSTLSRADAPPLHRLNFATALMLSGHVCGGMEILHELHDEQNPAVKRLRDAINAWQKSLTWWQKFNWQFGRFEPARRPLQLDFLPGEL